MNDAQRKKIRDPKRSPGKSSNKARGAAPSQPSDPRGTGDEVATLRNDLDRHRAQVESLQAELAILRGLSDRFRETASRHAQAIAAPRLATPSKAFDLLWAKLFSLWPKRQHAKTDEAELIARSGLFDADWYLKRYPDVEEAGVEPLGHYLRHGAWEGRDPNPLFDSTWYLSRYPEVRNGGLTPLAHFASTGAADFYDPNPLFHTAWYVVQNPDVVSEKKNPLLHYIEHGSEPGRNPNPLFDSAWYLSENKDVRDAGMNPLSHYMQHGIAAMRDPHPLFDSEWYLTNYEHVNAAGLDALEHYLTIGVFEGCRPGPEANGHGPGRRPRAARRQGLVTDFDSETIPLPSTTDEPSAASPTNLLSWQMQLSGARHAKPDFPGRIGIFIHLFYENLAEEIAASLLAIPFDFDVYISTNNQAKKAAIEAKFRELGIEPTVKVVQNRGWDLAPFVVTFADEIRAHEICLKLHGKASKHAARGNQWRKYLLSGLIGHRQNVINVVAEFLDKPELGVVMLPHWPAVARQVRIMGVNYKHIRALVRRVGLKISADQKIEFPSGSMFWFRSAALAPLLDLGLTWNDFADCRPRNVDATIAHAVERCVLIFAATAGYKWAYLSTRGWWRRWRLPNTAARPSVR